MRCDDPLGPPGRRQSCVSACALGDATRSLVAQMAAERRAAFAGWLATVEAQGLLSMPVPDAARYLDAQLTLILVRLKAGDPADDIRADARRALGVLLVQR